MITKIISGGQTGVDRAALDVAIKMDIPHGGWVPLGRKAEDGIVPRHYNLKETSSEDYEDRTERNVVDSDATLIISRGGLTGGSHFTRQMAIQHGRPWFHVDLSKTSAFGSARTISAWIYHHDVKVLNVAGPRAGDDPEIYELARKILEAVFYLDIVATHMPDPFRTAPHLPATADQAVSRLISDLTLRDKTRIARMEQGELLALDPSLGEYVRHKLGSDGENEELLNSCRSMSGREDMDWTQASAFIVERVWKMLRISHRLRVVK